MAVRPALRRLGMMTPWAPAHSAVRRMAPRLWVGYLVAHHQQRRFALVGSGLQDALHGGVFPHGGQRDHALMGVGAGHVVQLAPVGLHHHDAGGAGFGGDVPQRLVRLALGDIDLIHGRAHPQGFDHRVAPLDNAVRLGVRQRASVLRVLCISHDIPHAFCNRYLFYHILSPI